MSLNFLKEAASSSVVSALASATTAPSSGLRASQQITIKDEKETKKEEKEKKEREKEEKKEREKEEKEKKEKDKSGMFRFNKKKKDAKDQAAEPSYTSLTFARLFTDRRTSRFRHCSK